MSAYRIEARSLYCAPGTPWVPLPGTEFGTWEYREEVLRAAADAAARETVVRVGHPVGGCLGQNPLAPHVAAALRRDDGSVVVADRAMGPWVRARAPESVIGDVCAVFPRAAVDALCDVAALARPWGRTCPWVDVALDRMREWAACPDEVAAAALREAVGRVGEALDRRWADPDRAHAVIFAGATLPGAGALSSLPARLADDVLQLMRLWDRQHGWHLASVGLFLRFALDAAWPGDHAPPEDCWLELDRALVAAGEYPYLAMRGVPIEDLRRVVPPRLQRGRHGNLRVAEAAFADVARRAIPVEVAALADAVRAAARKAESAARRAAPLIRGHRVRTVVDDV